MSWALHTAGLLAAQARTLGDAIAEFEAAAGDPELQRRAAGGVRAEAAIAAALAGALKRYFFSLSEPE